MSINNSTSH